MSEQQQYEGEKWTKESISILKKLGWVQRGDKNFDVKCVNKKAHYTGKKSDGNRKNDHGVDSFFTYNDPYIGGNNAVIVESKSRQWKSIKSKDIKAFINQTLNTLECASENEELRKYTEIKSFNTGLIFIWCNEKENYNHEEFIKELEKVEVPNKKIPYSICVASNYDILRWCSLISTVDKIERECENFEFFYPSDYFNKKSSCTNRSKTLNIVHMFSKYIFAKSRKTIKDDCGSKNYNISHIFYYSEPTIEELKFMRQLANKYQLEDCHEVWIHFYGDKSKYRNDIEEFKRIVQHEFKQNEKRTSIKFKTMEVYNEVPISIIEGEK